MSMEKMQIIGELGWAIMRWQDATQKYDQAVGEIYELTPSELLCLSFLWSGAQTASAIAKEVRLTPAAVTAMLDRLEKRNYVRRRSDPTDRRKVLVEQAEASFRVTEEAYGPLKEAGNSYLERYSAEELDVVKSFLIYSAAIQDEMLHELLRRHGKTSAPDSR